MQPTPHPLPTLEATASKPKDVIKFRTARTKRYIHIASRKSTRTASRIALLIKLPEQHAACKPTERTCGGSIRDENTAALLHQHADTGHTIHQSLCIRIASSLRIMIGVACASEHSNGRLVLQVALKWFEGHYTQVTNSALV